MTNNKHAPEILLYIFVLFASVVGTVFGFTKLDLIWSWYGGAAFFIGVYGLIGIIERLEK